MSCSLDRMRRYWPEKEKVTAEGCWSAYADPFNPLIVALAVRFVGGRDRASRSLSHGLERRREVLADRSTCSFTRGTILETSSNVPYTGDTLLC